MKKILTILLALCLILSLVCGCTTSTTNSPQDNNPSPGTNTPSSPSDSDDEVFELTFSYFGPENITPSAAVLKAFDKAAEESNGRLQFDSYFSGTLLPSEDIITGCQMGTADIVLAEGTQLGEFFELNNVFSMGFTSTPPSRAETSAAYRQLLKDCPSLQEELADFGLIWLSILSIGGYHICGVNKLFDTPESISGKNFDALGKGVLLVNAMGGIGSALDPGDYYLSLDTGLLDGQFHHFVGLDAYGTVELLKKYTFFLNDMSDAEDSGGGLYAPAMGYIMNLDSWNALPADLQQILCDCLDYAGDLTIEGDKVMVANSQKVIFEDRGDEYIMVTDANRGPWNVYVEQVVADWEARCSEKGYDGAAVYDHLMELFGNTQ